MVEINIKKSVKLIKAKRVISVGDNGVWYNGKFYSKLSSFTNKGKGSIVGGVEINNKKFYTTSKKRTVSGFAPKNLL